MSWNEIRDRAIRFSREWHGEQCLSEAFGQYYVRLPLIATPHIVCGNALRLDWKTLLPQKDCCTAFVSTNSITQGEQVGKLWNELFRKNSSLDIHFCSPHLRMAERGFRQSACTRGNHRI